MKEGMKEGRKEGRREMDHRVEFVAAPQGVDLGALVLQFQQKAALLLFDAGGAVALALRPQDPLPHLTPQQQQPQQQQHQHQQQ